MLLLLDSCLGRQCNHYVAGRPELSIWIGGGGAARCGRPNTTFQGWGDRGVDTLIALIVPKRYHGDVLLELISLNTEPNPVILLPIDHQTFN